MAIEGHLGLLIYATMNNEQAEIAWQEQGTKQSSIVLRRYQINFCITEKSKCRLVLMQGTNGTFYVSSTSGTIRHPYVGACVCACVRAFVRASRGCVRVAIDLTCGDVSCDTGGSSLGRVIITIINQPIEKNDTTGHKHPFTYAAIIIIMYFKYCPNILHYSI